MRRNQPDTKYGASFRGCPRAARADADPAAASSVLVVPCSSPFTSRSPYFAYRATRHRPRPPAKHATTPFAPTMHKKAAGANSLQRRDGRYSTYAGTFAPSDSHAEHRMRRVAPQPRWATNTGAPASFPRATVASSGGTAIFELEVDLAAVATTRQRTSRYFNKSSSNPIKHPPSAWHHQAGPGHDSMRAVGWPPTERGGGLTNCAPSWRWVARMKSTHHRPIPVWHSRINICVL